MTLFYKLLLINLLLMTTMIAISPVTFWFGIILFIFGILICASPLIINYLKEKYNKNWINITSKTIQILLVLVYLFFSGLGFLVCYLFSGIEEKNIPRPLYQRDFLNQYLTKDKKFSENAYYRVGHFPLEIPKEAKEYKFYKDGDAFGDNIDYLTFKIDSEYINNYIDNLKDRIEYIYPYNEAGEHYKFIDSLFKIKVEDQDKYTLYVLKMPKDDNHLTSGFVVSNTKDRIYIFYSSFNIENKKYD